jgi:hypothetical protein
LQHFVKYGDGVQNAGRYLRVLKPKGLLLLAMDVGEPSDRFWLTIKIPLWKQVVSEDGTTISQDFSVGSRTYKLSVKDVTIRNRKSKIKKGGA